MVTLNATFYHGQALSNRVTMRLVFLLIRFITIFLIASRVDAMNLLRNTAIEIISVHDLGFRLPLKCIGKR